ncbi:MAG: isoleucine--tRNA ligase [Victivallaceae bacterium]|nr:isoleucine--tRNA ligase [Victivallaceae bacterium]
MAFKNVSSSVDFPRMEEQILEFWRENKVFEKSMEQRKGAPEFVFYDGPPFATGLPHYGHLLAGSIKDVVPRYQAMRGKYVERRFGWDCHGLPVENEMEKNLGLDSKRDIESYGIAKFNESCRSIVLRYTAEWEKIVGRMGRWVDFRNGYRTMDRDYMESIWQVFRRLWDMDLIYEGYKILPYCPRCATPLSNFEANQGYKDVVDQTVTVRFRLTDDPTASILAWTTTPWTLPSNLALAVGPEIDYVKIKDGDEFFYMAAARVSAYYKTEPEIVWRGKGSELAGLSYEPLFDYFKDLRAKGAFRVITAEYVSTEDGTGIVHIAPGFGEDDALACKAAGLKVEVCPIDDECRFTSEVPDYAGRPVKSVDPDIIARLKAEGKLVHRGQIKHSYPHCWRDDGPLIYRSVSTWFVNVEKIKDRMIKNNKSINWVPGHLKEGRFGKWLENARDWAISRNRYWGTPLPIWRNDEGEVVCIGSVAELEQLSGQKVEDLHKHFVDAITIPSPTGKSPLRRVPEVLDCWFESGSMPYAQQHYPFENKERFEKNFPADFIAEGLDQTRGWFYTLVVLASALFDRPPFRNVVVNGLVLAEDGEKMSKRKKNYPNPMDVVNRCGADALRLFMLGSQVVRAEDLKFSEAGVKEILRNVMIPMWNALSFFVTYANVDGYSASGEVRPPKNPANVLDRWILSSASQMVQEVRDELDNYHLQKAANRFSAFIEDLTNWYIRRSRRRFWKSDGDADKMEAYATLHYVLLVFAKTAAPFIPFTTEAIYQVLRTDSMPLSVHLCDYPEPDNCRDERLERQMRLTMLAVTQGRFLRTANNLKVRQPLARAIVATGGKDEEEMLRETAGIIAEELNVKAVEFCADEEELVSRSCKANFKALGAKLGKNMKEAAAAIAGFSGKDIGAILAGKPFEIKFKDGNIACITADDLVINRVEKPGLVAASSDGITIALSTELTKELLEEGFARELVSRVQNIRKEKQLNVEDRIVLGYTVPAEWAGAVERFADYISKETLAVKLVPNTGDIATELNDVPVKLGVERNQ